MSQKYWSNKTADRVAQRVATLAMLDAWRGAQGVKHVAPWGLNRLPYHHFLPPYGVPVDLRLEPDAPEPGAGAPASRPPAAPRASAASSCPDQRAFSLRLDINDGDAQRIAVSTPPLPWPARIVGLQIRTFAQPES